MVGVAVMFEAAGAAGVRPEGVLDGPGSGAGVGDEDEDGRCGDAGKRSWISGTADDGPGSAGRRVASTGEVAGSVGLWMGLGVGGGMDGRRGFGRRTGGVSCWTEYVLVRGVVGWEGRDVLVPPGACNRRGVGASC